MAAAASLQSLFLLTAQPVGVSGNDGLTLNQTARLIAPSAIAMLNRIPREE